MNYPRINKGLIIVGSGGHRDSSKMEREREEVVRVLTNGAA
jgi:hypothetical protein